MDRISDLERKYVIEALNNGFRASKRSEFNQRLEMAFMDRFNVMYAISHANGTCTLHTALAALGIGPGDEVIVPALTMSSPALAVLQNGSVPVFADVDGLSFTIGYLSIRDCITPKTKAIISVSLYGQPPDYGDLQSLCNEFKLYLIEDNALGFSSRRPNTLTINGHFASYSFQGSKQLTSGEGGMLLTNSPNLAEKARRFSRLGFNGTTARGSILTKDQIQDPNFNRHLSMGFNYKMSELCAAVALAQVERADELIEQRKAVAELYCQATEGFNFIMTQHPKDDSISDYWTFAFFINSRHPEKDWYRFRDLYKKNGGDGFYAAWKLSYNEPLFQQEVQYYDNVWQQYRPGLCPQAEFLQPRMIQLKTNYWNLEDAEKQAEILHKTLSGFKE